jgi:hypothetical protein
MTWQDARMHLRWVERYLYGHRQYVSRPRYFVAEELAPNAFSRQLMTSSFIEPIIVIASASVTSGTFK